MSLFWQETELTNFPSPVRSHRVAVAYVYQPDGDLVTDNSERVNCLAGTPKGKMCEFRGANDVGKQAGKSNTMYWIVSVRFIITACWSSERWKCNGDSQKSKSSQKVRKYSSERLI